MIPGPAAQGQTRVSKKPSSPLNNNHRGNNAVQWELKSSSSSISSSSPGIGVLASGSRGKARGKIGRHID
ncbi:hypothetical protein LB504_001712 [Fusarium proliferatum]|nr:hypothetical protein LB504_001712 [Fusarium proliferatum]